MRVAPRAALVAAVDLARRAERAEPLAELVPGRAGRREDRAARSTRRWRSGRVDAMALTTTSRFAGDRRRSRDRDSPARPRGVDLRGAVGAGRRFATWARLDDRARHADVTLLGTGVNPGFVMDRLPLQLAGACVSVSRVRVERVVDAAKRRGPLRKKVGEGLSPERVSRRRRSQDARPRRAARVGAPDRARARLEDRALRRDHRSRRRRRRQRVSASASAAPHRRRRRAGSSSRSTCTSARPIRTTASSSTADPPLDVRIAGGTQGDRATVGTMVNALARMRSAPRGLVTVADVFV